MWVSLIPTDRIQELAEVKYEVYQAKVLNAFRGDIWDEMVKVVRQAYPKVSNEKFERLKSSCHDFVSGRRGFRQMVSGQQELWKSLDEDEQDDLLLKWTPD